MSDQSYTDASASPRFKFNTKAAVRFCELIDPDSELFEFRLIPNKWLKDEQPDENTINYRGRLDPSNPRSTYTVNYLKTANRGGRGVFMQINKADGAGVKAKNICRVRAVFADLDDGLPDSWPLDPSFIVNSSPGKYQAYWLVKDRMTRDQFAGVMRGISEQWGSANEAKDIARVLRVPGFWHQKDRDNPYRVKFEDVPDGEPVRYRAAKLVKAFWVAAPKPAPIKRRLPNGDGRAWTEDDVGSILDAIPAGEWDTRDNWLRFGMALHHHYGGDGTGYDLWCRHASQSAKFDEKDSAHAWRSFGKGSGVTLGTLVHEAKQNGWQPERRERKDEGEEASARERARYETDDSPRGKGKSKKAKRRRVRVMSFAEFTDAPAPREDPILGPWLTTSALTMLHAWRGTGKTSMALAIANAAARGESMLGWHNDGKPRTVLYVDGEMPTEMLQRWMLTICGVQLPDNLKILSHYQYDQADRPMLNLYTENGRQELDDLIDECGAELIILDAISSLCRGGEVGSSNDSESWQPVDVWARRHRNAGRTIIFLHHEGKSGSQRGTSAKEDTVNTVMRLKRIKREDKDDRSESEFDLIELSWEKHRGFHGRDAEPITVVQEERERGTVRKWRAVTTPEGEQDEKRKKALAMLSKGVAVREVARQLGVSHGTVINWRDADARKGWHDADARKVGSTK